MAEKLETITAGGMQFRIRPDSSDVKAIREVVERRSYWRRDFQIGRGPWVDLGANVGAFTCVVAKAGCRVVAYEPDPDSFRILAENVALNGLSAHVELRNAAVVLGQETEVTLHVNSARRNFWRNSIVKPWRGGHSVQVPAAHYLAALPAGWDVKMDIEGAEMPLLEQLTGVLGANLIGRLVFEWSFDIDKSIPRFSSVVERLRSIYGHVVYGKFDEREPLWKWFPPCRTVWCFDEREERVR